MTNPTARVRLLLGGAAAAGVILAHVAAFLIAEPHSHARHDLLASTGHRYWAIIIAAALALLVGGLLSLIWNRVHAERSESAVGMFLEAAPRLALLQVVGFLALESVERLSVGHSLTALTTEPVVVIGVLAQIVVAILGAALIGVLSRVVDAVVAAVRRRARERPQRILTLPPSTVFVPSNLHLALGGLTLRGPPLLSATR